MSNGIQQVREPWLDPASAGRRHLGERIRVVICDDHRVLAQGLAAVLAREADMDVTGLAASAAELLEVCGHARADVVLMDYDLPDGDGVAATRSLKKTWPQVKVVMLTSYTDEAILAAAMDAGCSGYITKHHGGQVVATAVRMAAAGEALISATTPTNTVPTNTLPTNTGPTNAGPTNTLPKNTVPQRRAAEAPVVSDLTPRELEVLELMVDGASTQAIAARMYLSTNTVRNYAQNILTKLGAHSRLEAVSIAVRQGIVRRSAFSTTFFG